MQSLSTVMPGVRGVSYNEEITGAARGPVNSNLGYVGLVFLILVLAVLSTTDTAWESLVAPAGALLVIPVFLGMRRHNDA